MGKRWVMNASPVILLAKAQVIHFVPQICEQFHEAGSYFSDALIRQALELAGEA